MWTLKLITVNYMFTANIKVQESESSLFAIAFKCSFLNWLCYITSVMENIISRRNITTYIRFYRKWHLGWVRFKLLNDQKLLHCSSPLEGEGEGKLIHFHTVVPNNLRTALSLCLWVYDLPTWIHSSTELFICLRWMDVFLVLVPVQAELHYLTQWITT